MKCTANINFSGGLMLWATSLDCPHPGENPHCEPWHRQGGNPEQHFLWA